MRILYLNYDWDPRESTGAMTHIRELSRHLSAMGHDVHVEDRNRRRSLPSMTHGGDKKDPTAPGPWKSKLSPYLHESAALVRALLSIAPETALVRRERPDVVLVRHSLHQFSAIFAARRCGVPVVYEVNAPAPYEYRKYRSKYFLVPRFAEWLETRMLGRTDGIFVVSEILKRHFVGRGIPEDRIRVVPNGADVRRFRPDVPNPEVRGLLGDKNVIIGFVGSFARFHGIDHLRYAIDLLSRERPQVRFLLVGSGEMGDDLRSHCSGQGLDSLVHFTGHVTPEKVPGLMAAADILLAPYAAQDFFYLSPIKIFEYMAAGKPILAASVGQIAEVIQHEKNGLLYQPDDMRSFSQALFRLVDEPGLRQRLGESARHVVETRYTWQANAEAVGALLDEAVAKSVTKKN
jgi:glycosyltransferase involved in cell wall biosynthesis